MCSLKWPWLFQRIRRAHQEEAQRIARDEAFEERLVHALQVLGDLRQRVLRRRAELHREVVAGPVEIDGDGGELALRQHGREVHGQRGGADAALGPDEGIDLAQFAFARHGMARRAFQAAHRLAELAALEGLQQELVGSGAHAGNHRLAVGMEIGDDREQIRRRLLHLLDGLDGALGIARDVHDESGVRVPLQVLQYADVQIGRYLLVFRDHLGVGNIEKVVLHHLAEMFVARSDHQCGISHGILSSLLHADPRRVLEAAALHRQVGRKGRHGDRGQPEIARKTQKLVVRNAHADCVRHASGASIAG